MVSSQPERKPNTDAYVYARVSFRIRHRESALDSQVGACVRRAQELGFTVVGIGREVYSGAKLYERPVLAKVREAIRAGEYGALVFHAVDRLSRDPMHLALIEEGCTEAGCNLVCVSDHIDTNDTISEGQPTLQSKGHVAQEEREKIKERNLRGKRQRALDGKIHCAGPELYGYRRDKEAGVRIIYEPEAAIVRQIFEWVACERIGAIAVARRLNEQGVPPPSVGKMRFPDPDRKPRWVKTQVQNMLRNPVYKGESFAWRTQRMAEAEDRQRETFDSTAWRLIRPREEWIKLPDHVTPPIVSPEIWQAVQEVRGERKALAAKCSNKSSYLLRGMVRCGVCGTAMYSNVETVSTVHQARIYRCSSREKACGACGGSRINADALEAWVWEAVGAILCEPRKLEDELVCRQRKCLDATLINDLEVVRRQIASRAEKLAELKAKFTASADDSFLWKIVKREIERLEIEKLQWQKQAEEIEKRLLDKSVSFRQLVSLLEHLKRVGQDVDSFGFDERRMALEALQVRIEGNGREWTLYCCLPTEGGSMWSLRHEA